MARPYQIITFALSAFLICSIVQAEPDETDKRLSEPQQKLMEQMAEGILGGKEIPSPLEGEG